MRLIPAEGALSEPQMEQQSLMHSPIASSGIRDCVEKPVGITVISDKPGIEKKRKHLTTEAVTTGNFETIQEFKLKDGTTKEAVSQLRMRMPGWKRVLDLTLIVLTYPIWLSLMLLVMTASKIFSPGPVFYKQQRVGFRGRTFMICKFRSMMLHAQTLEHEHYFQRLMRNGAPMTKLDASDPRIIPWGRFLRATGLDELPQIFNVLRGEMSLIGPRPCTPLEFEKYKEFERERVNAPPGLTGYWQVNGKNRTTFQQMIEMDLFYVKNSSVRLDLWILAKTPAALIEQTLNLVQQLRSRQ